MPVPRSGLWSMLSMVAFHSLLSALVIFRMIRRSCGPAFREPCQSPEDVLRVNAGCREGGNHDEPVESSHNV